MILTVFHVTVCLSYIIFLNTMDDETIKSNLIIKLDVIFVISGIIKVSLSGDTNLKSYKISS